MLNQEWILKAVSDELKNHRNDLTVQSVTIDTPVLYNQPYTFTVVIRIPPATHTMTLMLTPRAAAKLLAPKRILTDPDTDMMIGHICHQLGVLLDHARNKS